MEILHNKKRNTITTLLTAEDFKYTPAEELGSNDDFIAAFSRIYAKIILKETFDAEAYLVIEGSVTRHNARRYK